jgi:hypothetical protein
VHCLYHNLNGDYPMKKLFTAALVSLACAGTASADQIYIDNGANYGGNSNTAAGDNTTGWKDSLKLVFTSNSVVSDVDGDGPANGLEIGDTITSSGGMIGAALLGNNFVTSLVTSQVGGGPSDNGYASDWALSFRFDDLMGTWNGVDFDYTSGNIDWFILDQSNGYGAGTGTEVHLFTTSITDHVSSIGNQLYTGTVGNYGTGSVNGVDAGDIFNIAYGNGSLSLEDYTNQISDTVRFRIDQNTDKPNIVGYDAVKKEFALSGQHDGSLEFSVPEPASVAILGLGLLGFAASRRKA